MQYKGPASEDVLTRLRNVVDKRTLISHICNQLPVGTCLSGTMLDLMKPPIDPGVKYYRLFRYQVAAFWLCAEEKR